MNNYIIVYPNELNHHGVKGMKWGVRRKEKREAKQRAKVEKYRTKLANKAALTAARNKRYAEGTKKDLNDLKKYGTKSEVFKNSWEYEQIRNESKARTNAILDSKDGAGTKALKLGLDFMAYDSKMSKAYKEMVDDHKEEYKSATNRAKKWEAKNTELMNLDISNLSKKDIKKIYKSKS